MRQHNPFLRHTQHFQPRQPFNNPPKQLLTQPTLCVDLREMREKFVTGEYGIIQNYIDFNSAIEQIAIQFDTIGVWAAIDSDAENMTMAAMVSIDCGITEMLFDLKRSPLYEFLNQRVMGLSVTLLLGTLFFFQPIYSD